MPRLSASPFPFLLLPLAAALLTTGFTATAAEPSARVAATQRYDIAAGTLDSALNAFAAQAGILLAIDGALTAGKTSRGLQGDYTVPAAFDALLVGSGVQAMPTADGGYALRALPPRSDGATLMQAVRVTAQADTSGPRPDYNGGQVASGASLGALGDRDFLDTPFNVIAYTAALIENQQAQSVADVVANDPSVRSVFQRGSYIDHFMVRGFRVANNNLSFGGLYALLPSQVAPIEGVERVEVFKGANTFLGGAAPQADANVSGSINLVPKRAASEPLTRLTASYESDALFGTHLDVGRRFGENQRYGVRVNAVVRDGDTAIDLQSQKLAQFIAAFDARFSSLRLSADLGYLKLDGGPQPYSVDVAAGLPVPKAPDASRNYNQRWEQVEVEGTVYGMLRAEADLPYGITAYVAGGGRDEQMEFLYTNPYVIDADGSFVASPYALPWHERALTGEAGLRGRLETGAIAHAWNVGITRLDLRRGIRFVAFEEFESNLYAPVDQPAPDLAGVYDEPHKTFDAAFTSYVIGDTLSFADERVQLTLGARHQDIDTANFSQATGARGSRYRKNKVTPMGGLLLKPRANVSLYANYIEGLAQGPVAPNTAVNAGEVFEPYVTKQYELGAKADWGGWATTLGLFQLSQPQGINRPLDTDPVTQRFVVDGEQRVRGIELQTFGEPLPGFRAIGGVTYMDGEQVKTEGGVNEGSAVIGVPEIQLNLNLEWDAPMLAGFTVWQRTLHTSTQYLDEANTQKLPEWTRLDAGVRQRIGFGDSRSLLLRASVENLLDKDYWVSSVRGLTLNTPRTLLVSASIDF